MVGVMNRTTEGRRPLLLSSGQSYGTMQDGDTSVGEEASVDVEDVPVCCSFRLLITFIAMFALLCSFASQSILGASLLTMIGQNYSHANCSSGSGARVFTAGLSQRVVDEERCAPVQSADSKWVFWWSKSQQELLLFFFFLGYFLAQVPAGWLAHELGGRRVLLGGSLVLAAFQGLALVAPRFLGYWGFAVVMGLTGFANGFIYAPFMDVLAKWVPPQESSVLTSLAISGIGFGIAMVYGLSAATSRVALLGGWPFNFIVLGLMMVLLAVLVGLLVTDTPGANRFISRRELLYIQGSMRRVQKQRACSGQCGKVPWRRILTSLPVYAVAASQLGTDWIQYFFITLFPLYLQRVRHLSTHTVDMVAGIPWVASPLCSYVISKLVDRVRERRPAATTAIRKIVDGIGKLIPMSLLVVITYLPTRAAPPPGDQAPTGVGREELPALEAVVVALYVVSVLLLSSEGSSWLANVVDLSPQWVGVVSSVCQVPSLLGSFVLPLVVQGLTPNNTEDEWHTCMLVMLAMVAACYLFYVIFGSSELQHWTTSSATQGLNSLHKDNEDDVIDRTKISGNDGDGDVRQIGNRLCS